MAGGGKEETGGEKRITKGEKGGEGKGGKEWRETRSFACASLIGFNSCLLKLCKRMSSVATYLDTVIFLYTIVQYSYSVQWKTHFFDNIFCEL